MKDTMQEHQVAVIDLFATLLLLGAVDCGGEEEETKSTPAAGKTRRSSRPKLTRLGARVRRQVCTVVRSEWDSCHQTRVT